LINKAHDTDMRSVRVGVVGDYSLKVTAHRAIPKALELAGAEIGCTIEVLWLRTNDVSRKQECAGIWCAPGSPYASTDGALEAIQFARETNIPFLGTCGGFQHAVIEYARNRLGISTAAHEETDPVAAELVVNRLVCSLIETSHAIHLKPGSRLARIYGCSEIPETYHCNFGFNPRYEPLFEAAGIEFTARDADGGVRALELPAHPFFIGTLFQPERSALTGQRHALIAEFVRQVSSA